MQANMTELQANIAAERELVEAAIERNTVLEFRLETEMNANRALRNQHTELQCRLEAEMNANHALRRQQKLANRAVGKPSPETKN